jgi:hypothetical protein
MSQSKIAAVVTAAAGTVPYGYQQKVTDVTNAVEQAASAAAETLVEKGVEMGGDEDAIRSLLVEVGLLPEPEAPAAAAGGDDDTPAWAERLIGRIDALEAAARRAGVRV